jgi:error-prone DNA polymerase
MPLLESQADEDDAEDPMLPALTAQEEVIADYRTGGMSLAAHPIQFERERLAAAGAITAAAAAAAPEGRRVRLAGIVLTRQRPATASGMIFLTIEDETGAANVVVRPEVWQAAEPSARRAAAIVVQGRIQRRGVVVHVVATSLETAPLPTLPRMSRDFA